MALQDAREYRVPILSARPAIPEVLRTEAATNVSENEHRNHHVVQWAEDRDELGDEVDGAQEPDQQADECESRPERHVPISQEGAHHPEDIGNQFNIYLMNGDEEEQLDLYAPIIEGVSAAQRA